MVFAILPQMRNLFQALCRDPKPVAASDMAQLPQQLGQQSKSFDS